MARKKRRSIWARGLVYLGIPLTVVLGLALVYAPYLPRFFSEGIYPGADWPAEGTFARVAGSAVEEAPLPTDFTGAAFDPKGRALFETKDGKALLVYQGGKLRFEHYADGYDGASRFNSYSMVKSLVGALVLKSVADGKIGNLQDPIGRYLPDLGDRALRAMPIKDFLFMRSGVRFEPDDAKALVGNNPKDIEATRLNPFSPMARLHMQGLSGVAKGLRVEPNATGTYSYQNVNTAILGVLLARLYDEPLEQLVSETVWAPAGASTAEWRRYGPGKPVTPYCCLYATAQDWVRVARFLAHNGSDSCQFLPQALWENYFGRGLPLLSLKHGQYGTHIYHDVLDRAGEPLQGPFTYLMGSRGQTVYLMPERDLVVVRFGEQIPLLHTTLYTSWRSIAPDLKAAKPASQASRPPCKPVDEVRFSKKAAQH